MGTRLLVADPTGAKAGDILRLWTTLKTEYITDLAIRVTPFSVDRDHAGLSIELVSPSLEQVDGRPTEFVWSTKEFINPLYLISTDQLFDLLIVGYRQIDRFFAHGEAHAPTRRVI